MNFKTLRGMKTIEQLIAEEKQFEAQLREIRKEIVELKINDLKFKLGVSVGDKIQFTQGRNIIIIGVLTSFENSYGSIYPIVTLYKKDGTLGLRTTRIWQSEQQSIKKIE